MENNKTVELSLREDYDSEELKMVHTSKASNLQMRKDKTTSSLSESKEFIIDIGESFDPEEPKMGHVDEGRHMPAPRLKVLTIMEELEEPIMQLDEDFDPEKLDNAHTFKIWQRRDFDREVEKAQTSKALNLESELIKNDTTRSSRCESEESETDSESGEEISESTKKYCIYKVPRDLRKINKEAYTPQVVSIGPLHHGKNSKKKYLIEMENQKLRYEQKFIERAGMGRLQKFESNIRSHEGKIRACYAENLDFRSDDFVRMILLDVVFIFELFLRNDQAETREFDILLDTPIRKAAIKLDLQLLENQLPYFILKKLFLKLGYPLKPSGAEQFPDPFLILALRFFYGRHEDHLRYSKYNLQHFTDLRRSFLIKKFDPDDNRGDANQGGLIRDLRCASKLHGSGVKFKVSTEDRSSLEIRCEYIKRPLQMMPCIKLQELVLEIPRFKVYDGTECLMRNVMAFEQLHYPSKTHLCNYIHLMDSLIDSEKDVDLLVEKGIIDLGLGDNAAVANMFNKLGLQVAPSYSCYYDIGEKLKAHYGKRWNHTKATLNNVYFSDPWITTGTVAAALLLLLTLVQAVCSILQVR